MTEQSVVPRIVSKLLEASRKIASVQLDSERLCYLVSDQEWLEILQYSSRFGPNDYGTSQLKTMHFAGIEVIARSAVNQTGGT